MNAAPQTALALPQPAAAEAPRVWPRRLALALLLGAALVALIAWGLQQAGFDAPVRVVIDGTEVFNGDGLAQASGATRLGIALALVAAVGTTLLALLVVVPMALLLAFVAAIVGVVLAAVCVVGAPLLAGGLVLALLLSPLLLLGWLVWRVVR